jgi:hypothetical protein
MKVFPLPADEQIAWFAQIQTEDGFLLVLPLSYMWIMVLHIHERIILTVLLRYSVRLVLIHGHA